MGTSLDKGQHSDERSLTRGPTNLSHTPGLVIAEVSYLLARDANPTVEAEFLRSFATGFLALADITVADLDRSAELVEQYADLPLGATDACLVTLAERLGIVELATLDRRHFSVVQPRHVARLELAP